MSIFRLGLVLPTLQTWEADFAISVINMQTYLYKVRVPGYENQTMQIMNRRSSLIAKSRQELVQDAIKMNCSHALFIDSDQIFPPGLVHQLAKHGKRVIGCNVATKSQGNSIPTARLAPKPGEWWGGHILHSKKRTGIQQVWRIGFGVMLLDLSIFKDVPLPWFNQQYYGPPINDFMGEDWFFCELMDKLNIPIFIDHDISLKVGHVGRWIFDLENCEDGDEEKVAA